jgi:O-antigen/teichoic acid export membrane protein
MTALVAGRARQALGSTSEIRRDGRISGVGGLLAAEVGSAFLGFLATMHLARRLGPSAFGRLEFAAVVAAWLLIIVRSGIETIVYREAARRPRLIGRFTDQLLGMKCAGAIAGYAVVLAIAAALGLERGGVVAVAGLVLFPSALAADVGPRAAGRLGLIAWAQALRALGYLAAAWWLVVGPRDVLRAAGCPVAAEAVASVVLYVGHRRVHGPTRPRFRGRAWAALTRRGGIASAIRFGRVGLYGADLLALGGVASADLGLYAASRRVAMAATALGLVVPAAVAPALGRCWALGEGPTRRLLARWTARLLGVALPATLGLALAAGYGMPLLFGPAYREGGPWLALVAARVPFLLVGTLAQTALVACRRERTAVVLVAGLALVGLLVLPASAASLGPWGVGWGMVAIEALGALSAWLLVHRLGIAPTCRPERGAES